MSSAISTDAADARVRSASESALQPWQFFVLVALACATTVTFFARGQGVVAVVLLGILMATTAIVGLAALRTVRPLVNPVEDRTVMIGERTRAALEREKMLALRAIKELEFDRAMGKLSESDWREMSGRLRARASRLMRQLDAGAGYREQIEKDVARRLGQTDARPGDARLKPSRYTDAEEMDARSKSSRDTGAEEAEATTPGTRSATALAERICASCATANDANAKFCKECGARL
jgi:hypothetical protein